MGEEKTAGLKQLFAYEHVQSGWNFSLESFMRGYA
jgi:hypothetical protein